ncbi:regulator of G-protein signaling 14 isoform 2-T2 [Anomaloglossus baeobatrachus]|uniref:regulator of G-protein signaling 14 isoform X2 n=1 Tax=Anomaloglossus baeobatrachus TaxID=238106 RepID=UPI003F5089EA
MPGKMKMKHLEVPNGRLVLAVSDGELNNAALDGRGSDQSLNSLPSVQTAGLRSERSVASWAVSFERLLQDSLGVEYFTEFLKKEYSAENIYFWKSCEKYQNIPAEDIEQLKQESQRIYTEYLSSTSLCPVNVDQQAVITEKMLEKPTPDLFKVQQLQIFNLMKFDSYARFVKSPLYQECMLSEVEGRPLPNVNFSPTSPTIGCAAITSGAIKKKNLRPGKSLPLGVEASGLDNFRDGCRGNNRSFKRKEHRGNVRDAVDNNKLLLRRESEGSQGSLNSARSLDLSIISSFSGKSEKALALDQECTVLTDQEVKLENRISFDLQIESMNKSLRIVSKPTKTIHEALESALKKYGLGNQHIVLRKMGESKALDQAASVKEMAGQTLVLQVHPDKKDITSAIGSATEAHSKKESIREKPSEMHVPRIDLHHLSQKEADHDHHASLSHRRSGIIPEKQKIFRTNQDIEGLVEMLNRVQNTRADDQRGLLCKDNLELPEFLKLPTDEKCDHCQTTSQDTAIVMETVPLIVMESLPPCSDISAEHCNEKILSSDSTSVEAVGCVPSNLENSNACPCISIDSHDTSFPVTADNVTSLQMETLGTEEKDTVL